MKTAFLILVFFHGLIHILGFIKSFGIKEIRELTLPVSKPFGIFWLWGALLLLTYSLLSFANVRYAWIIGFSAAVVSQILIILFWKDAKFGTLPNIIILIVSVFSFGKYNFDRLAEAEIKNLLNQNKVSDERLVSDGIIKSLPEPVKKWLHNSGIVAKPFITRGKIIQRAKMKMKPDQQKWMEATAKQFTTIDVPGFIWCADVKMNPLLNFRGRDKFVEGKGEMLIKINSLFKVVNERGSKLDEATCQRFLGEMVWFPSMALNEYIHWEEINDTMAKAIMNYKGKSAEGMFYFNPAGDFIKFSAFRYLNNEADAQRYEWVLNVEEHKTLEGINIPSKMTATWKLDDGDWTWLKLEILDIKYNENTILDP